MRGKKTRAYPSPLPVPGEPSPPPSSSSSTPFLSMTRPLYIMLTREALELRHVPLFRGVSWGMWQRRTRVDGARKVALVMLITLCRHAYVRIHRERTKVIPHSLFFKCSVPSDHQVKAFVGQLLPCLVGYKEKNQGTLQLWPSVLPQGQRSPRRNPLHLQKCILP